jgi:predicted metalloprotease with PDZ domain
VSQTAANFSGDVDTVVRSPARRYRSVEDMSRFAPFVDAAVWTDRTNWENTYISYYTWGAVLGLGLDLSLRARTGNNVTLDDYMRALWVQYGRPGGPAEGLVGRPYTMQDLRDRLAEVSGDGAFAADFFDRYIQGREVPDYQTLLARAGLVLRKRNPGRAWIGAIPFAADRRSARVTAPTPAGSPAYNAGIDQEDEILAVDGESVASFDALDQILGRHRPGDRLRVSIRRRGASQDVTVITAEDPRLEIVPIESAVGQLTAEQRVFRDAWLGSRLK